MANIAERIYIESFVNASDVDALLIEKLEGQNPHLDYSEAKVHHIKKDEQYKVYGIKERQPRPKPKPFKHILDPRCQTTKKGTGEHIGDAFAFWVNYPTMDMAKSEPRLNKNTNRIEKSLHPYILLALRVFLQKELDKLGFDVELTLKPKSDKDNPEKSS